MTAYCGTDRHEDPPVRMSESVRLEMDSDAILDRCQDWHISTMMDVEEQIDLSDMTALFWTFFRSRTPQERDEAHTECERIARAAAERHAKLRAEHPI